MTPTPDSVPLAKPTVGAAEAAAAARVIESGWVTQGPVVSAFEAEFADYVGASHAAAVANCTAALHLALLACGVGAGDEVITVSHSYIATANAIVYCGATPVFVDVEPRSHNMDPALVDAAFTDKTAAVLVVHQAGLPCDLARLTSIAADRGVPLIEDAACAIGAEIAWDGRWERIGRPRGSVACFSFHPRKVMTTGEGGMLTTNDPQLDARFRKLRQHGMSVNDRVRHGAREVIFEEHNEVGFNYRMTDIQAAIGIEQLKRMPEIVERRRSLAERYNQAFASVPDLITPAEPDWARTNYQTYLLEIPGRLDQRTFMQTLLDKGVASRRGIMNAHREASYRSDYALPHSEWAQDHVVALPLYPSMTDAELDRVVNVVVEAVG